MLGSNIKTIGLTGCSKDNRKGSVALNLASSIAEAGKKIILVAADNSCPILSAKVTICALEKPHICNPLPDSTEERPICHTDIDNLDLVISDIGYLNYSKKPNKESYTQLIERSKEAYDYILFDIPPLDAPEYETEMAKACDGLILVIKENTVDYKTGKKAKALLEKSDRPIFGAVLLQEV
jgi:Mrp family chromosome partitioning ATPase